MVKEPGEVSVDDPVDILQLAELLEGVSVDCPAIQSDNECKGDSSTQNTLRSKFWSSDLHLILIHSIII